MKEEEKYYKKKGLTQLGCWIRYKYEWCGKRIQGDGSDNGFQCSNPECESREDEKEPLTLTDRDQADLIFIYRIIFVSLRSGAVTVEIGKKINLALPFEQFCMPPVLVWIIKILSQRD